MLFLLSNKVNFIYNLPSSNIDKYIYFKMACHKFANSEVNSYIVSLGKYFMHISCKTSLKNLICMHRKEE